MVIKASLETLIRMEHSNLDNAGTRVAFLEATRWRSSELVRIAAAADAYVQDPTPVRLEALRVCLAELKPQAGEHLGKDDAVYFDVATGTYKKAAQP